MSPFTQHTVSQEHEKSSIHHVESTDESPDVHTDADEVPSGYWLSFKFLGTVLAIILLANSLFIGYVMPVNILAIINADVGMLSSLSSVELLF